MPQPETALQQKVTHVRGVLTNALAEHRDVAFANSLSAEDMVLTDLICRHAPDIEIFSLDTGRLPEETLDLIAKARARYGPHIRIYCPDNRLLEAYVAERGINAFYDSVEARKACCAIRKIEPLRRALKGKAAWITGLRQAQSITRATLAKTEWDEANGMHKINPLVDWTREEVWAYIRLHKIPYNALHNRNFPSIGCAPCTRAIAKGEDVRAGRWWWESPETKECGLHAEQKPAA